MARSEEFADEFPPFMPGKVFARADGTVLVQRYLKKGTAPELDVIDRSGTRIKTIVLPLSRVLVGLGEEHLYATLEDDMGVLTLERYRLP